MRGTVGNTAALAVYAIEVTALVAWKWRFMSDIDVGISLGRYDGPIGFERGILGGFLRVFAAMMVLQNGVGVLMLYRGTVRGAITAVISRNWRSRMNRCLHRVIRHLHTSIMGWSRKFLRQRRVLDRQAVMRGRAYFRATGTCAGC